MAVVDRAVSVHCDSATAPAGESATMTAMTKRILIVQAHPDNTHPHFCHALAEAYAAAARQAGHDIRWIDVAGLDFPMLRSQREWTHGRLPEALVQPQADILEAHGNEQMKVCAFARSTFVTAPKARCWCSRAPC